MVEEEFKGEETGREQKPTHPNNRIGTCNVEIQHDNHQISKQIECGDGSKQSLPHFDAEKARAIKHIPGKGNKKSSPSFVTAMYYYAFFNASAISPWYNSNFCSCSANHSRRKL